MKRLLCIVDARPPTQQSHVYVFEGFPELTTKMKAIELDDDVMKEIDDVLIEPQRMQIKLNIGSGENLISTTHIIGKDRCVNL